MMLPSRLGCPSSLKTPDMGNTGLYPYPGYGLLYHIALVLGSILQVT